MASIMYSLISVLLVVSQVHHGTEAKLAVDGKSSSLEASEEKQEVHIVYMGRASTTTTMSDVHMQILSDALGSVDDTADSILYNYQHSFNGFAAILTKTQAEKIRGRDEVVSVFKSQTNQHQTTESWEFLGLSATEGLWPQSNFGNGTIIGMLDTGFWPGSPSFNDDGFGPIPAKWKGSCVPAVNFTSENCNKKVIGAKFYLKGYQAKNGSFGPSDLESPIDTLGHGTHTASTAGGRQVANASFQGLANGTASGGAPFARLAIYKVCWSDGCDDADLLAAFDDAISDGVDLLSVSIGSSTSRDFTVDTIAIGAFHAVEKGIVVSCSAGNNGPDKGTVTNTAPWILTVAASTINRVFQSTLQLEGGPSVSGIAINKYTMNSTHPVVYGGNIPAFNASISSAASCSSRSLDPDQVRGKIVVCQQIGIQSGGFFGESVITALNGVGWVWISDSDHTLESVSKLPHTNVDSKSGTVILQYVNGTRNATGIILQSVAVFNTTPAPIIASFSSVGPTAGTTADVLKPDITAPGVNILAAWPRGVDSVDGDFNLLSGTSMACPHVTGAAALVKSVHPDWSPAAIKSAILTTATPLNTSIPGNYELASGAGLINPTRAVDPGLVFNTTTADYTNFLCSIGYNATQIQLVTGLDATCPSNPPAVVDLNYPTIFLTSNATKGLTRNITRTLTYVGNGPAQYSVNVTSPPNVDIVVEPSSLNFSSFNEEKSFTVVLTILQEVTVTFGSMTWSDGPPNNHSVRMFVGVARV